MSELKKIKDIVIYKDENYNTFPNALVLPDGSLMVCFRQAPDWQAVHDDVTHGDPSSIGVFVRSFDNGMTWTAKPELIYRHFYYGIQDPCINLLGNGTILGTFFMWKFTEREKPLADSVKPHFVGDFYESEMMDAHTTRSYDNGKTWETPVCIDYPGKNGLRSSLRGNIVSLDDGSLLLGLPVYNPDRLKRCVRIVKSSDSGKTWELMHEIVPYEGTMMGEPNLFRTRSGKIICFLRTHYEATGRNPYEDGNADLTPMHISISEDDGKTWSAPEKTKYTSPSPFHALQLKSGNVLMTYGHRYSPYGIKAVLLDGELDNIHEGEEILIRDDGVNHDLGYTSSVQMPNGDILVTYYIFHEDDTMRYIAGTVLREE